ncbi:MAG: glycerol-3-phosphate 1-O-acyltransferase PlsY [Acidobacteriota bacterium]|nr:glycerol-3-phosphate 1-O-acyltransferase PlsY [Acidobacteriota bacterium]MDQ3419850.1 glycerol-3-phosphate 1-O-acyltransferase PlsY [Acidobacteriota bacterium]
MLPILLGYLAGSVPFAYLLARLKGIDVRIAGSGNVGAANVLRTTGPWRGVIVMSLDVAKGIGAVAIAHMLAGGTALIALTGAAAVVGHVYPVWLRFHGGKGVAVAAGVFTVLSPGATAMAAGLFLIIAWITRYVSLASIAATLALPPAAWIVGAPLPVILVAAGTAILILFRHRTNWSRLRRGTERRMGVRA